MPTPDVTVEQCQRPPHPTVWLEVAYWGTTPPAGLFADLEMIGWQPPVAAAPPASAIDWEAPDPATGERFTLRPWRVEGAVVEPPRGSGPRGHWTTADRDAFLLPLHGVLRRHGLHDDPAPASPGAAPAPARPAGAPTDLAARPGVGAERPGTRPVWFVVDPGQAEATRAALAPAAVREPTIEPTTRSITSTYRGSTFEQEVPAARVAADLPAGEADRAVGHVCRSLGLDQDDGRRVHLGPVVPLTAAPEPTQRRAS